MRISRAQGGPVESGHVSGRQAFMCDVSCSRMREPEGDELRETNPIIHFAFREERERM